MDERGQRIDDPAKLKADIREWGLDLGFQQIGVSDVDPRLGLLITALSALVILSSWE